jgi:hypothetical protein
MPTQSLSDAIRLYESLGKYVPDIPNEDYLDYVNTILENIKQSGNYQVYVDAIQIMNHGETNFSEMDSMDVLNRV